MSNSSHVCVYIRSTQITETKQAKSEAFRQLVPTEEEVGRQHIREWTGLELGKSQRAVEYREKWRKLVAKSSVVPQRPSRLRD